MPSVADGADLSPRHAARQRGNWGLQLGDPLACPPPVDDNPISLQPAEIPMIRTASAFAVVVVLLLLPAIARAESRLLRQPTYSNGRVAFSYFGDLWIANYDCPNAHRLTDPVARDVFPRFSPDGKWIAFSSNREGNFDVYVMSSDGGRPKQLTFHSADDNVVGWSPDGKKVMFTSTRGVGAFPSVATLFEIPADGGMEQPMPLDWGSWASYSPDGSKLAFTRHPGVWSRKHYRGSYAVDLWLMDVADKQFRRLGDSDYKGNYLWPMFGQDGQVFFVADRLTEEKDVKYGSPEVMKSANNIWRIPASGGAPGQGDHTHA